MTNEPNPDDERSDEMKDADEANGEGRDEQPAPVPPDRDSPGATIDSEQPAEPNEPA